MEHKIKHPTLIFENSLAQHPLDYYYDQKSKCIINPFDLYSHDCFSMEVDKVSFCPIFAYFIRFGTQVKICLNKNSYVLNYPNHPIAEGNLQELENIKKNMIISIRSRWINILNNYYNKQEFNNVLISDIENFLKNYYNNEQFDDKLLDVIIIFLRTIKKI